MTAPHVVLSRHRINPGIACMGDYTLRKTDVSDAYARAVSMRLPIVDGRLGDPTVKGFDLRPPKRFKELIGECMEKSFGYRDATGSEELKQELSSKFVPPEQVFISAGISGIVRPITIATLGKGDEVLLPEWSYILALAESSLRRAQIVNVNLEEDGQIDVEHLKNHITENTKMVYLTTVGNPLGVAMTEKVFADAVKVINEKEKDLPIYLLVDVIYEGLRINSPAFDSIEISERLGRKGPTIELNSISKLMAAPGARLGWARVYWGDDFKEEKAQFLDALSRVLQPMLGYSATVFQNALAAYIKEVKEDKNGAKGMHNDYTSELKRQANLRVLSFAREISQIDGITFPHYYRPGGNLNLENVLNSFYVLFGIDKKLRERGKLSLARQLGDFLIDNRQTVLFGTPADSFLESSLRGRGQEYMRIVSLFNDELRPHAVEGIRQFVQSLKK